MPVHVMRLIGKTSENGRTVDVPDAWLDVRRSDTLVFEEGSGFEYQKTQLELKHYDDENAGGNKPEPNKTRKTRLVKIIPPDEDPDNPSLWFEVEAIEELTIQDADQRIVRLFDNSKDNETRRNHVSIRRIFHYDTPYDDDPKLAEGGIIQSAEGAFVRDYRKITEPDTKDPGQYLDVEIIETYQFDDYRPEKRLTPPYEFQQRTTVKLDAKELMDNSEDPNDPAKNYEPTDVNPPWRLDPYQSIINVQLGGSVIVILQAGSYNYGVLGSYRIRPGKEGMVKFLAEKAIPYQAAGTFSPPGINAWAFKVSSGAKDFIDILAPTLPGAAISGGVTNVIYMDVYAIDRDLGLDKSLDRAWEGKKLTVVNSFIAASQNYSLFKNGTDSPSQVDPPGLLWSGLAFAASGETVTFKIRNGRHRDDGSDRHPKLPNKMWQLYPLGKPRDISSSTHCGGYILGVYRLDAKGTGQAYGVGPNITLSNSPQPGDSTYPGAPGYVLGPTWFRAGVTHFIPFGSSDLFDTKGILYADPPPLITSDNKSKDGGKYAPFNNGTSPPWG